MKVEWLGTPCRNFTFMCGEYIFDDPLDGGEKYAISASSARSHNGHVYLFDPNTLETEDLEVPGGTGSWGVLYLPEYGRLVLGTCGQPAGIHCLDLKTRTWMESKYLDDAMYIWSIVRGKDGAVYVGSGNGCQLHRYDPATHTLTCEGRVSSDQENVNAHRVYAMSDGNIMISVGFHENGTFVYDVNTRQFRQVFQKGEYTNLVTDEIIQTNIKGTGYLYDAKTYELLEGPGIGNHPKLVAYRKSLLESQYGQLLPYKQECHMKRLKDGRIIGFFKQQVFIIQDGQVTFHDLKATPPEMILHTLAMGDDGILWFATGFGQTMGSYDPETGKAWNSVSVARAAGEIYGIVPHSNGQVYFSAYVGGDHIVYDPKKPWDQFNNVNPKTLQSVAPQKLQRPATSILGPDGNVWTSWCSVYGVYGGGISRINVQTNEVTGWFGVIPEQSICFMASGDKYLYATSHWLCSGLPYRFEDEFWLLRLDTDCNILWSKQFQLGQYPEFLTVLNGRLYMSMRDRLDGKAKIYVYDEPTMELLTVKELGSLGPISKNEMEAGCVRGFLNYSEDKLVVFVDDKVHLMDALTLQILQTAQLNDTPTSFNGFALGRDKSIYVALQEELYRVTFD